MIITNALDGAKKVGGSTGKGVTDYLSGVSSMIQPVTDDVMGVYNVYNPKIQTPLENNMNVANYNELANIGPAYMDMSGYKKMSGKDIFIDSQLIGAAEGAAAGMSLGPWGALGGAISGNAMHLWKGLAHNNAGFDNYQSQVNSFNTRQIQNYNNNLTSSLDRLNYDYIKNQKVNYAAFGGNLFTQNSGPFTEIKNGGSHEENPYGGVPQGFGNNGKQNLVEQGEVKYNNFMFSKRIYPSKEVLNRFKIPTKYFGLSAADIAKKFNLEAKERPSDPISNTGQDTMLNRLQQAQEYQKVVNEAEKHGMTPEQYMQAMQQQSQQQPQEQQNSFAYGGPKDPPVVNYRVVDTDGASKPFTPQTPEDLGMLQKRLYNNLTPYGYSSSDQSVAERVFNSVVLNKKEPYRDSTSPSREDAYRVYLGLPQLNNTFTVSNYAPTKATNKNTVYYALPKTKEFVNQILTSTTDKEEWADGWHPAIDFVGDVMYNYTLDDGVDAGGTYRAYYDKWDLKYGDFGKPFEIYDRIYYKVDQDGNKIPVKYNTQEILNLDINALSDMEKYELSKDLDLYGFDYFTPGAEGPSDEALQKRLNMVKTLYKAVPGQTEELIPVQPQYNATPNKYGKPKKNITKSNDTREYKGFNNAVNSFAEGGLMDGPGDPPVVADATRVQTNNIPYNHPVNQQQAVEAFIQEYIKQTAFLNAQQINEFNQTLNPAEQAVIQKLPQQAVVEARNTYVDSQTGTVTKGKDYNAVQDWWRDFTQTQKGGEIVKFINNPIINQAAVMASGGAALGLMGAGWANDYGQGASAGEVANNAAFDIGTMLIVGRILNGKAITPMSNELGFMGNQMKRQISRGVQTQPRYNMAQNKQPVFTPNKPTIKTGGRVKENTTAEWLEKNNPLQYNKANIEVKPTSVIEGKPWNMFEPNTRPNPFEYNKPIVPNTKPTPNNTFGNPLFEGDPTTGYSSWLNKQQPYKYTRKPWGNPSPKLPDISGNQVNKAIINAIGAGILPLTFEAIGQDYEQEKQQFNFQQENKINALRLIENKIAQAAYSKDYIAMDQAIAEWKEAADTYQIPNYKVDMSTGVGLTLAERGYVSKEGVVSSKPISTTTTQTSQRSNKSNNTITQPIVDAKGNFNRWYNTPQETTPAFVNDRFIGQNITNTKTKTPVTRATQTYTNTMGGTPKQKNYKSIDYNSPEGQEYMQRYNSVGNDWNRLWEDWRKANPNSKYSLEKFKELAHDNKYGPVHEFIKGYSNTTPTTNSTDIDFNSLKGVTLENDIPYEPDPLPTYTKPTATTTEGPTNNWNQWKDAAMFFNPARLAPLFNDMYNLYNQEGADPTLANSIRGAYTPIQAEQFGQAMSYDPYDWRANEISQRAKAQSAQQAMMNIAGGNTAAATANLALQNAINQGDIAANYKQGLEYNNANRANVLNFNNQLDQANAMNRQQVNQYNNANYMNSLVNSAQVWDQEKKLIEQTRGHNQNMFAQNLGDLGKEDVNYNMIQSNPYLLYSLMNQYKGKQ